MRSTERIVELFTQKTKPSVYVFEKPAKAGKTACFAEVDPANDTINLMQDAGHTVTEAASGRTVRWGRLLMVSAVLIIIGCIPFRMHTESHSNYDIHEKFTLWRLIRSNPSYRWVTDKRDTVIHMGPMANGKPHGDWLLFKSGRVNGIVYDDGLYDTMTASRESGERARGLFGAWSADGFDLKATGHQLVTPQPTLSDFRHPVALLAIRLLAYTPNWTTPEVLDPAPSLKPSGASYDSKTPSNVASPVFTRDNVRLPTPEERAASGDYEENPNDQRGQRR